MPRPTTPAPPGHAAGQTVGVDEPVLLHVVPPTEPPRLVMCRGDCGHPLTNAVSRAIGWGPECLAKRFAERRGEIEQDALPGV